MTRTDFSTTLRGTFWVLFFIQIFLFAWFTGAIVRNEQSLYVWIEYSNAIKKFGQQDAIFTLFLYLLYYCFFFEVSYLIFVYAAKLHELKSREDQSEARWCALLCSSWCLFTLLLLGDSIFEFLRNLPTDVMRGWLLIGWSIFTIFAVKSFIFFIEKAQFNFKRIKPM